jgi:hypothetical protein
MELEKLKEELEKMRGENKTLTQKQYAKSVRIVF